MIKLKIFQQSCSLDAVLKKSANPIVLPSHPASPVAAVENRSGSKTKTQMCVCPAFQQTGNEQIYPPHLLHNIISLLFTEFTHHLHLSKKSFKFLEVESRATVGGAATGSLSKPKNCVENLRDIDGGKSVNIHTCLKHRHGFKKKKKKHK